MHAFMYAGVQHTESNIAQHKFHLRCQGLNGIQAFHLYPLGGDLCTIIFCSFRGPAKEASRWPQDQRLTVDGFRDPTED